MFYAALDVSLRSVAICIIDHDGKICFERSVRSEVPDTASSSPLADAAVNDRWLPAPHSLRGQGTLSPERMGAKA